MCVICFYDTIILFYCISLVYENKTYIYINECSTLTKCMIVLLMYIYNEKPKQ